jgi:multiple sugar transport system substrate-binding protein
MDRRDFLRLAGGAAALATVGGGCGSGSQQSKVDGGSAGSTPTERTLRIAQWSASAAGISAYDDWFDNEYTQRWGEQRGVRVVVEHFRLAQLSARAEADVAAQSGHDIFGFTSPPADFEDHVLDHRELVEEVEAKLGKAAPQAERSVRNPRTGKYFGFPEFWTPHTVHYRKDLWDATGGGPTTWDDVVRVAPELRASGHPVGIGLAEDQESTWCLLGLMHAYGSSVQDADGNLTLKRPATAEAVKVATNLFRTGMTDEVFSWDAVGNNRLLASGKGALIINGVAALRAVEAQDPELASKIQLRPMLAGPAGARSPYLMGIYVIWKFASSAELAGRFLVDLAVNYREAFIRSEFYKMPSFPGAVPDLWDLVANDERAKPADKYGLLAKASEWSTNLGHPGYANAAVEEVLNRHVIPRMFASAARGMSTVEEAVAQADAEAATIFDKWRERGKI